MNLYSDYIGLYGDDCGVDIFCESPKKKTFKDLKTPAILHRNIKNLLIGLKKLKDMKIVICDIKPENLMFKNNTIKMKKKLGCKTKK